MIRYLAFPTALVVVVAIAIVQGRWSGRWSVGAEIERAAARLDDVPLRFGDWSGRDFELDEQQLAVGEIVGYAARRYRHEDGREVTLLLVCGRPGPISVHTPDWCYGGAGYETEHLPSDREIASGPDRGDTARFAANLFLKEKAAVPMALRIYWAWNAGGGWKAPENPRLAFAARPFLHKLYVVCNVDPAVEHAGEEECEQFLREFLPVVDVVLTQGKGD